MNALYDEARVWIHRNARELDLCIWKHLFENGSVEDVLEALAFYQNADGGFGHMIEPDSWNPHSTPSSVHRAIALLDMIGFRDYEHPIMQGIMSFLESGSGTFELGWCFTVPSNDDYAHAPWWNFGEEANKKEHFGLTAEFCAFILKSGQTGLSVYDRALDLTKHLFSLPWDSGDYGEMGVGGMIGLLRAVKQTGVGSFDTDGLYEKLRVAVTRKIEHDVEKWQYYGTRPSNLINSPDSEFYADNADIVEAELSYLIETRPKGGVWGITWTWFDNMDKYLEQFTLSKNWWMAITCIEKMIFLRNFNRI